ncbi:Ran GTPase binding protein Sbp1 [Binucleata daphniae]
MLPTDTDQQKITEEEKNKEKTESKIKEKLEEIEKKIVDEKKKEEEIVDEKNTETDKEKNTEADKETNNEENKDAQKVAQENIIENSVKNASPFLTSAILESEDKDKLKSKLESVTQDEVEGKKDVIFEANCKLYRFVPETAEFKTRGVGKIYINKVEETNLYKIVMNRDKINRIACNHYISPCADLSPHKNIKNLWIWHTFTDSSDQDAKLDPKQTFAVLIKDEKEYNAFKEKYDWAKEYNTQNYKKK